VEISPAEVQNIEKLSWDKGNPLQGQPVSMVVQGKQYLKHAEDRACIFLNRETNLCRIHARFGESAKPRGCRIFPFHIRTTFPGEYSVTGRFDCPTIRDNSGEPFSGRQKEAESLIRELGLKSGFGESQREGLKKSTMVFLIGFLVKQLAEIPLSVDRAGFLLLFSHALQVLGPETLNRESMRKDIKGLAERTLSELSLNDFNKPSGSERLFFRTLLSIYLRRDEDVIGHTGKRFRRLMETIMIVIGAGRGDFQKLGDDHPTGRFSDVKIFSGEHRELSPETAEVFWRMIDQKLQSFQFMGSANFDRAFFSGLLSLSILYPLVVAVAAYHAASSRQNSESLQKEDLGFAVGCIEHSFGRHPLINASLIQFLHSKLLGIDPGLNLIYFL
jgi:lysine-N-methylase